MSESSSRTYSSVWAHFTIVEEKAQCNYCFKAYKQTGGSVQTRKPLITDIRYQSGLSDIRFEI
ncbi:hypothetical protein RhiirA1_473891 [Rhizophagus irregularis]|uniref:BED-type domain-containing protein n=1 Tax=Rhizophagus irregularis TaxID=588596 RepID=A0A2N0QZM6_9GLOM|nr:hypothetical protein RhiirA1_473891 [Rhizophagus irregularis]